MRKSLLPLVIAILFLSSTNSWSAVKPGTECKKLGLTSVSGGLKFTCIKSGKKLIWSKGIKIPAPSASKSPLNSAGNTFSDSSTSNPAKTPQALPTPSSTLVPRWDESDQLDSLLSQFSTRVNQASNFQPETIIEFGKGTNDEYKNLINIGLPAAAKFWSADIAEPLKFPVVYSGIEDRDWFLSRIAFYGHSSPEYIANVDKRIAMDGDKANLAGVSYINGTYLMQFFRGKGLTELYPLDYSTVSHEYSHAAQTYFLKGEMKAIPCWAMEGGANVYANMIVGLFIRNTKADEYVIRNGSVRMSLDSKEYDLWTATDDQIYAMIKSIEPQNSPQCTFPGKLGYSLGMLMYEQLLGKYGQAKAIAWMEESPRKGWQNAFESVFGMKVDDWYKNVSIPYVKAEVKKIKKEWPRQ